MKLIVFLLTALAPFLACPVCLRAAPARVEVLVLGDSLDEQASNGLLARFESMVCSTNTPPGTTIMVAAIDNGRCRSLGQPVVVPALRYDSPRARRIALAPALMAFRTAAAAISPAKSPGGVALQYLFEYLRGLRLTNSLSILVAGTPILKSSQPRIDFETAYPSDGTISAAPETAWLGLGSFKGVFSRCAIVWWTPGGHPLAPPNERKLIRYLSLACGYAGAELAVLTDDLPTALNGFGDADLAALEKFQIRSEPVGLWPYHAEEISKLGLPPRLAAALEELRAKGTTRALAASWQTPSDIDLVVNCAGQFPGEECSWRRPSSGHLHLLGDLRKATAQEFEIIILDEAVNLDAGLDVKLNLFASDSAARGLLLLMDGDRLFRIPFEFPPESRGNHGSDPRTNSPHWISIDIPQLLASPAIGQ